MKLGSIFPRKINLERVSDAEVLVTLSFSLSFFLSLYIYIYRFLSHLKERSYLSLLYDYYGELVANFNISANFLEMMLINFTFSLTLLDLLLPRIYFVTRQRHE